MRVMNEVMTSDFRRALCSAICSHTLVATPDVKHRLAADLDALPFERMGDTALLTMARKYVPGPRIEQVLEKCSPVRYEVTEFYLCSVCRDQHIVEVEPGAWGRCPQCNTPAEAEPDA